MLIEITITEPDGTSRDLVSAGVIGAVLELGITEDLPGTRYDLTGDPDDVATVRRYLLGRAAMRQRGRQIFQNAAQNAGRVAVTGDTQELIGSCAGVQAFVLGAGPSLGRGVESLPGISRSGVVIAVSRAARFVLDAGVRVDLVIVSDPGDEIATRDLPLPDTCRAILSASASPASWAAVEDPYAAFAANGTLDSWAFPRCRAGVNHGGIGSTLCHAISIAISMGCAPIVLLGADLAWASDAMHATGTARAPRSSDIEAWVPGFCGEVVPTSQAMISQRMWIEEVARDHAIINASRGALIAGCHRAGLQDLTLVERGGWSLPIVRGSGGGSRAPKLRGRLMEIVRAADRCLKESTENNDKRLDRIVVRTPLALLTEYERFAAYVGPTSRAAIRRYHEIVASTARWMLGVLQ